MDKQQKGILIGTVIGAVAGAGVALLTAPKSGKELRSDISSRFEESLDKTSELRIVLKEKIRELTNLVNKSSGEISNAALEQIQTIVDETKQILEKVQEKDSVKVEDFKDVIREIMEEELKAGKQMNQVVKNELKNVQAKLLEDLSEIREVMR